LRVFGIDQLPKASHSIHLATGLSDLLKQLVEQDPEFVSIPHLSLVIEAFAMVGSGRPRRKTGSSDRRRCQHDWGHDLADGQEHDTSTLAEASDITTGVAWTYAIAGGEGVTPPFDDVGIGEGCGREKNLAHRLGWGQETTA
jgi:hypothetical protein